MSVNSLESPEKRQEIIEIEDGEVVEVWAMADPVLQFLEKLRPEERDCHVFTLEEKEKLEKSAPDMTYLRVVLAIVNGIGKEEVLLDSSSQIVSRGSLLQIKLLGTQILAFKCRVQMGHFLEPVD